MAQFLIHNCTSERLCRAERSLVAFLLRIRGWLRPDEWRYPFYPSRTQLSRARAGRQVNDATLPECSNWLEEVGIVAQWKYVWSLSCSSGCPFSCSPVSQGSLCDGASTTCWDTSLAKTPQKRHRKRGGKHGRIPATPFSQVWHWV